MPSSLIPYLKPKTSVLKIRISPRQLAAISLKTDRTFIDSPPPPCTTDRE